MTTMNLKLQDGVHILSLTNNDDENKFTQEVMNEYLAAFDTIDEYKGNTSLLICCDHPKTFSTGIDLAWLMAQSDRDRGIFVKSLETVTFRLALLSAPTVVAINGNAYAGGAILASAADFRLMRQDRGRFCYPEIDIKIPFTPVLNDICDLLPNKHALKHMMLTGRPYTGVECEQWNIVDSIHPENELQSKAVELAHGLAQKDRETYVTIRNLRRPNIARHADSLDL